MITKITVQGTGGPLQVFPAIKNPFGSDNYICDEVDGLGPVRAQINTAKVGLLPGTRYNSQTLEERQIVLHWRAMGVSLTLEQERELLRDQMGPGAAVTVMIETSIHPAPGYKATGYVESLEPDIITQGPNPGMEMVIRCPDPMLYLGGTGKNGI